MNMKTTDIYKGDSQQQMRHCDTCSMPNAHEAAPNNIELYSVTKHTIMETKLDWDDPKSIAYMRSRHEEQGTLEIFEAALKCIRCAGGLTLIINGRDMEWRVGGDRAVG